MGGCGGKEAAKPQNSSTSPPKTRRPPDKVEKQPVARVVPKDAAQKDSPIRKGGAAGSGKGLKKNAEVSNNNAASNNASNNMSMSMSNSNNNNSNSDSRHVDPSDPQAAGSPKGSSKDESFEDGPCSPVSADSCGSCQVFDCIAEPPPEDNFLSEHERQMSFGPPRREEIPQVMCNGEPLRM